MTSISTRSGSCCRNMSKACWPSRASMTLWPSSSRIQASSLRLASVSSTTRIFIVLTSFDIEFLVEAGNGQDFLDLGPAVDDRYFRAVAQALAHVQQHAQGRTVHVFGGAHVDDVVDTLVLGIGAAEFLHDFKIETSADADSEILSVAGKCAFNRHCISP